ncbi:MAG: sensor histidine kinase N-terminal domain-containing protein [Piscinibacter sp.]|nr:sensor histidine kinase N-terminal domain-containing protein [Piscinibacter sp.]
MNLEAWHRLSLRRTLLTVLLPGMLLVVGAELWLTWRTAVDASNAAYDRSLLGAIKSIDANISTASGGLGVELPYRMLEFFQLTASGSVFYRIATEDGLVEIGDTALPPPARPLQLGQPQFADTAYFGTPVRLGSYTRLLDRPLAGQTQRQRVVIQVAETLGSREQFTRSLVLQALGRDLALVLVAGLLLAAAVAWALRPLARLRAEVEARSPQDLRPVAATAVPADVRPLVDAINGHVERTQRMTEARRRFIDDASHQLRTPLATLATQVGFALRESDPAGLRGALHAVKDQLDEAIRQTNQMLVLAHADAAELVTEPVDLVAFAEDMARRWWKEAAERGVDLGLDAAPGPLRAPVHAGLLREALANLLHNAIRYTPRGGQVTVRVMSEDGMLRLGVVDDGPGIPADELARAGERFFRASNAGQPGSGLGLAIVRSIAERHGGRFELAAGPGGRGLAAWIILPGSTAPARKPSG